MTLDSTPWEGPVPEQGSLASVGMTDTTIADGTIIVMSSEVGMAASLNLKTLTFKRHWLKIEKANPRLYKRTANHVSDKGLVSRMYKEFSKLHTEKITHFFFK